MSCAAAKIAKSYAEQLCTAKPHMGQARHTPVTAAGAFGWWGFKVTMISVYYLYFIFS